MKLAWVFIIIGGSLFIEGTIRIVLGLMSWNLLLVLGGAITGWLLGGWLIDKGYHRLKRAKD